MVNGHIHDIGFIGLTLSHPSSSPLTPFSFLCFFFFSIRFFPLLLFIFFLFLFLLLCLRIWDFSPSAFLDCLSNDAVDESASFWWRLFPLDYISRRLVFNRELILVVMDTPSPSPSPSTPRVIQNVTTSSR